MKRLGPGSQAATLDAIKSMSNDRPIRVLDIGCGVGTHTFIIAQTLENARVIAIDNNPDYIKQLNDNATQLALTARVEGVCMSMFEMSFEPASFDYIFAEGSIYIAGFTSGLEQWKKFLKPGGSIICSEISWIVDTPSSQAKEYWEAAYPQIATIASKINQAQELGYTATKWAILPPECWTTNYYVPLQNNLDAMRQKYTNNQEAQQVIEIIEQEIDMYNNHGSQYSYVFYTLQLN